MESIDVAVVGLGGIGSAAAWFAAKGEASVMGFERFALGGHHRGASHDHSRIIRHSYHAAHYVALTFDAYDAWGAVEQASGETCVHVTGGVDLFPAAAAIDIDTYRRAMLECAVPFDELCGAEVRSRWPVFTVDDGVHALFQQSTGIVSPATTVALMQQLAVDAGASLRGDTVVRSLEPQAGGGVTVTTDGGSVRAAHVIVAADAWTAPLLAPLGVTLPLVVTKEQVTYYDTAAPQRFAIGELPVWIWMDDPAFYGFPTFGRPGVKVAEDCGGRPVDPDDRGFEPDQEISARTDAFVAATFGGSVGPATHTTTCLYTLTTDRDFVLDTVQGLPITVALGAGHGYKFAAWFGRTLARLAEGVDPGCDLTPFRLDRPGLAGSARRSNWLV
jgi:sarcosine oxidase